MSFRKRLSRSLKQLSLKSQTTAAATAAGATGTISSPSSAGPAGSSFDCGSAPSDATPSSVGKASSPPRMKPCPSPTSVPAVAGLHHGLHQGLHQGCPQLPRMDSLRSQHSVDCTKGSSDYRNQQVRFSYLQFIFYRYQILLSSQFFIYQTFVNNKLIFVNTKILSAFLHILHIMDSVHWTQSIEVMRY